jgi:hypothetical protein
VATCSLWTLTARLWYDFIFGGFQEWYVLFAIYCPCHDLITFSTLGSTLDCSPRIVLSLSSAGGSSCEAMVATADAYVEKKYVCVYSKWKQTSLFIAETTRDQRSSAQLVKTMCNW